MLNTATLAVPGGGIPKLLIGSDSFGPLLKFGLAQAFDEDLDISDIPALIEVLSDPEFREVSITDVLTDIYGLTPAEGELAQLLAQGRSLEEAAQIRGVTLNTARSQLKQVFAKTDTNRQGQLLQLVLSGVASIERMPESQNGDNGGD